MLRKISAFYLLLMAPLLLTGCEQIYYMLHKEGAQEKKLIGSSDPTEYNAKVAEIQSLLKLYGYAIGKIDGKIGPNTRNMIVQFQKENGLPETRFVDSATWQKMNIFTASGLVIDGVINIGQVQMALKNAGFDTGPVDGRLGKKTTASIIAFQKKHRLKADGIIGLNTLQKLETYLPKRK